MRVSPDVAVWAALLAALLAVLLAAGGCESVPGGSTPAPEVIKEVELLGPYFVRFEGERIPVDEFLFRMRELGREAARTGKPLFGIRIVVSGSMPVDQRLLNRIMEDLQVSGVSHVRIG